MLPARNEVSLSGVTCLFFSRSFRMSNVNFQCRRCNVEDKTFCFSLAKVWEENNFKIKATCKIFKQKKLFSFKVIFS